MFQGTTITYILINCNDKTIETLPEMGKTFKSCIIDYKKDSKYYVTDSRYNITEFIVGEVIEPIVRPFTDNNGRVCISIIIGYQVNYNPLKFDNLANSLFNDVLKCMAMWLKVTRTNPLFDYSVYCIGHCQNHSYILSSADPEFSLNHNDEYKWLLVELSTYVDPGAIYNVFPKDKIILPSKKS